MDTYKLEIQTEADSVEEAIENFQWLLSNMSADPDDIRISMDKVEEEV